MKRGLTAVTAMLTILLLAETILAIGTVNAQATWNFKSVDAKVIRTSYSLALDSKGNPHMCYLDAINEPEWSDEPSNLTYASWNGTYWDTQVLDYGGVGYTGIAIDANNNPHITYSNGSVWYATRTGANWSVQRVDNGGGGSIAIDSKGNPHIAYADSTDRTSGNWRYANWNGTNWTIQTIDSTIQLGYYIGTEQFLALDSNDRPFVLYGLSDKGDACSSIKLAKLDTSGWNIQTIISNASIYLGNLVIDSRENLHFSYYDEDNRTMMYSSWSGTCWISQIIATEISNFSSGYNSLAIDSQDNPSIAYSNYQGDFNNNIVYARFNGETWDLQNVTSALTLNMHPLLALDSHGNPSIGYTSPRMAGKGYYIGTLVLATSNQSLQDPTSTTNLTPSPTVPEFPALIILPMLMMAAMLAFAIKKRGERAQLRTA